MRSDEAGRQCNRRWLEGSALLPGGVPSTEYPTDEAASAVGQSKLFCACICLLYVFVTTSAISRELGESSIRMLFCETHFGCACACCVYACCACCFCVVSLMPAMPCSCYACCTLCLMRVCVCACVWLQGRLWCRTGMIK